MLGTCATTRPVRPYRSTAASQATGRRWSTRTTRTDRQRVVRMVYEVCTFQALREQLRCKEIWVVGADRWRNPAEDLPTDFEERRVEHYAALRKPLDPTEFIDELREEMRAELDALHAALPSYDWLTISDRASGRDQADSTGGCAGATQPAPTQAGRAHPLGCGAVDRHAQGGGAAYRLPAWGDLGRRSRQPARGRAGRTPVARDLRLRHQHRHPRRRRQARTATARTISVTRGAAT